MTVKFPKEAKAKAKGVVVPKGARTGPKRPSGWWDRSRSIPDHYHHALPPPPSPVRAHAHTPGFYLQIRS